MLAACADRSVPSAEENAQLDNAAELLDSASNELEGIDENAINQPADNAAERDAGG